MERDLAKSAAGVLKDKTIVFAHKATKTGKLYAAISQREIAEALSKQLHVEVPEADVVIAEPIKSIGAHTAKLKEGGQELDVKVKVKAEE